MGFSPRSGLRTAPMRQGFIRTCFAAALVAVASMVGATILGSFAACSKGAAPEVHMAQAAPAQPQGAAPAAAGQAEDTTAPSGVDLSKLDEFERKVFFRVANKESSVCGKAHSLMFSAKNDGSCRKARYALRYVARLVDAGYTDSEIGEHLQKRYRAGAPKTIDLSGAPVKGNPAAPIVLVEFVDYECPHCKRVQPVMKDIAGEFPNDVRIYFKHYPLGGHTNARLAAEAAVAAQKQGKFWQYSDKIWENSEFLTPALLEKIAQEVGLDVAKWRKDLEAADTKQRVESDKSEGGKLGIMSTPTIYLNGRLYADGRDVESMRDWINEELGR